MESQMLAIMETNIIHGLRSADLLTQSQLHLPCRREEPPVYLCTSAAVLPSAHTKRVSPLGAAQTAVNGRFLTENQAKHDHKLLIATQLLGS